MGDHYKVKPDHLDRFVQLLEQSVTSLEQARTALTDVREDQIGTERLDKACDEFQESWKYGTEQLRELIGSIKDGVKANKVSYEEMERELGEALDKMKAQLPQVEGGK